MNISAVEICTNYKRSEWLRTHATYCVGMVLGIVILFAITTAFAWSHVALVPKILAVLGTLLAVMALHGTYTFYKVVGKQRDEWDLLHKKMLSENPDSALNPEHQDPAKYVLR